MSLATSGLGQSQRASNNHPDELFIEGTMQAKIPEVGPNSIVIKCTSVSNGYEIFKKVNDGKVLLVEYPNSSNIEVGDKVRCIAAFVGKFEYADRNGTPHAGPAVRYLAPAKEVFPVTPTSTEKTKNFQNLLIGKWQGTRHLTEYLPNHTRLMDDVALNPPRTWRLVDNKLSETDPESGTIVYTIISLSKNKLVVESPEGNQFTLKRAN